MHARCGLLLGARYGMPHARADSLANKAWRHLAWMRTLYATQVVALVLLAAAALHMYTVYPQHLAPRIARKQAAERTWELCQRESSARESSYVDCTTACAHAASDARLLALEDTLWDTVGAVVPKAWRAGDVPGGTAVGYVFLRVVDNLASNLSLLLLVVGAALVWLVVAYRRGPGRAGLEYALARSTAGTVLEPGAAHRITMYPHQMDQWHRSGPLRAKAD